MSGIPVSEDLSPQPECSGEAVERRNGIGEERIRETVSPTPAPLGPEMEGELSSRATILTLTAAFVFAMLLRASMIKAQMAVILSNDELVLCGGVFICMFITCSLKRNKE